MNKEFNDSIIEIIDLFYKLKNQYQESYKNQYITPIIQNPGSKLEKRKKYIKLPPPKCVNCKRNVGTLFRILPTTDLTGKDYYVKCGDEKDPCPLSIRFTLPNATNLDMDINSSKENSLVEILKGEKEQIIKLKNNGMFGFITKEQLTKQFNEINKNLLESGSVYETYIDMFIEKTMSPQKETELNKLKEELEINKQIFKEYTNEFKKDENLNQLHNSMEYYVSAILPLVKKIGKLTYSSRYMEDENGVYYLKLVPYSIEDMEVYYGNAKIIEKKIGMPNQIKTIKKKTSYKKSKKTKKQLLLIEEEPVEVEKESNGSDEEKETQIPYNEKNEDSDKKENEDQQNESNKEQYLESNENITNQAQVLESDGNSTSDKSDTSIPFKIDDSGDVDEEIELSDGLQKVDVDIDWGSDNSNPEN